MLEAADDSGPQPLTSREKVLDVAEALFARRGYAAVGLQQVARESGLKKPSLFHHFASKRDLYEEVLARVLERLEVRVRLAHQAPVGPVERLELWLDSMVDGLAEHPTTARLALRSLFEDDVDSTARQRLPAYEQTLRRLIADFQELVREGIAAGVLRPVSPGHLTQTLIGATIYHFASAEFGDEVTGGPIFSAEQVQRRKDELKALLRHGVLAPPAGGTARELEQPSSE